MLMLTFEHSKLKIREGSNVKNSHLFMPTKLRSIVYVSQEIIYWLGLWCCEYQLVNVQNIFICVNPSITIRWANLYNKFLYRKLWNRDAAQTNGSLIFTPYFSYGGY